MNVLSLFDGISCGKVALDKAGIEVDGYFASEVDRYAIAVSRKNHPDIKHLGDINGYLSWDLPKIDLIIGGSPCQGFSVAGKQLNFEDPRSKLFFKYVEILERYKPKYFLLENVKMKKEFRDRITEILVGIYPDTQLYELDSSLVSAQRRKRLYWTNIRGVDNPEDRNILLKDIVHENTDVDKEKAYCISSNYGKGGSYRIYRDNRRNQLVFDVVSEYMMPYDKALTLLDNEAVRGKIGYFGTDSQGTRVYTIHGKSVSLCGEAGGLGAKAGGLGAKTGLYLFGCLTPDRYVKRQNGQRFSSGEKFYTLTAQDQHGILKDGYIRKLTPIECERLQTLPDGYTAGFLEGKKISNNQRYKMLGNGWTVDIIVHIFGYLKGVKDEQVQ